MRNDFFSIKGSVGKCFFNLVVLKSISSRVVFFLVVF